MFATFVANGVDSNDHAMLVAAVDAAGLAGTPSSDAARWGHSRTTPRRPGNAVEDVGPGGRAGHGRRFSRPVTRDSGPPLEDPAPPATTRLSSVRKYDHPRQRAAFARFGARLRQKG